MSLEDFISCYDLTVISNIYHNSKVKSFKISSESVKHPQTFNLILNEAAEISMSINYKFWRFNREEVGKLRSFTIIIAKYDKDSSTFTQIEADANLNYVKYLSKGTYICWALYNQPASDNTIIDFYFARFSSSGNYSVYQGNPDTNLDLVKEILCSELKQQNLERINIAEIFSLMGTNFLNSCYSYYAVFNQSENIYKTMESLK